MSINIEKSIPKIKIRQVEFRTHAHATESIQKVANALLNLVPGLDLEKKIEFGNLSGTFGQRITDIHLILKKQNEIKGFIQNLAENLSSKDKSTLTRQFTNRLDEKFKFYIRLDKQKALKGNFTIAKNKDAIQIIISNLNQTPMIKLTSQIIEDFYRTLNLV